MVLDQSVMKLLKLGLFSNNILNTVGMLTVRPSRTWGPFCKTTPTLVGSEKVTKPNPLDRPDSVFFITTQSTTSPYREKYLWSASEKKIKMFENMKLKSWSIQQYKTD